MVDRILVVDDVAANRILLHGKLAAACYRTLLAEDGAACLRLARRDRPGLILLDLGLPDMAGTAVLRQLRADAATSDIPVIAMTGDGDRAARLAAYAAGADAVLGKVAVTRAGGDQLLMARLRSLIRARTAAEELATTGLEPGLEAAEGAADRHAGHACSGLAEAAAEFQPQQLIAILGASPAASADLRARLQPLLGGQIITLPPGEALAPMLRTPEAYVPEAYVIDSDFGGTGAGLRMLSELRSRPRGLHAAICILHAPNQGQLAPMAFDLGASDVAAGDGDAEELAARLRAMLRRKRAEDRLRARVQDGLRMAMTDPLTGLHNRRYARARLAAIAARAEAEDSAFAVMICDIDHFKRINDGWGHATGDAVLVEVARRLRSRLGEDDLLARIGGEEFLVALADTGFAAARSRAAALCHVIEDAPFPLPGHGAITVTLSIGLALGGLSGSPEGDGQDMARMVAERADQALLAAKAAGRNRVICDDPALASALGPADPPPLPADPAPAIGRSAA